MKRLANQLYTLITVSVMAPIFLMHSAIAATPAVGAGSGISAALKADGTVWAWGMNDSGQLGNKSTVVSSLSPVQVTITDVTGISVGGAHMLAIKSDKSVWGWGSNNYGQLGNGKTKNSGIPVQVTGLSDVIAVRAGTSHSAALKSDGSVWAWGLNDSGQLGNGTLVNSKVPVQVSGLTNVTAIAIGNRHILALKADGSVWAWGLNDRGQLGNGTYATSSIPVQVQVANPGGEATYLTGATAVACGNLHSLAIMEDKSVMAWGFGNLGQLGNGEIRDYGYYYPGAVVTTIATEDTPSEILTDVAAVSSGTAHTIALMADGSVVGWGSNSGKLGNATPAEPAADDSTVPVNVTLGAVGAPGMVDISAGSDYTLALGSDNKIWGWGANAVGQLGNGSTISYPFPVIVTGSDGKDFLMTTVTTTTPTPTTPTTPTTPGSQASCQTSAETDADRIFNWAESKYPNYFSPPSVSQAGSGYRYRYYSATQSYLGYKDGAIYHYDPAKWNAIISVGRSCLFLNQAQTEGF